MQTRIMKLTTDMLMNCKRKDPNIPMREEDLRLSMKKLRKSTVEE